MIERGNIIYFQNFGMTKGLVAKLDIVKDELESKKGFALSYQVVIRYLVEQYLKDD